ncbi:MAG: prefoldin subunit alpha [Nanoarchaeota archaeon]|nr:prefoldin subunit alpha [Nanoarchaeota archaeon]MBU1644371.1 prefoldin subunit alpha [Nanoarchaeota archaeon]MBU1977051.1 prefoldin subunit alpha [Nanoarchaeota archaeon]
MTEDKKIQEKYLQFQMLQQQIEQISQHLEILQQQNEDLDRAVEAVTELGKTKTGKEILAPLANGIFLKTELKDNERLIVNVGADVTVEKTIPEVTKLLEEQKTAMLAKSVEAETVLEQLQHQMMEIYKEVQEEKTEDVR